MTHQIGSTGPGDGREAWAEVDSDADTIVRLPLRWWQQKRVAIGAAVALVLLVIACLWLASSASTARERMTLLEARAQDGFLAPPSGTRTVRLRLGSNTALGGGTPQRVELHIEAPSNTYKLFRVTIGRNDGTSVMRFDRLQRDSNGEIRFALNSTLLPPGAYTIEVDGYTWRGETEPMGRVGMRVNPR